MDNQQIGKNAGLICYILDSFQEMTVNELCVASELTIEDFYLALGWLARENKISFYDKNFLKWICLIY